MTSNEIRMEVKNEDFFQVKSEGFWLREIAAQLAELNETLRSDRSLPVIVYPSPDSIPVKISEAT